MSKIRAIVKRADEKYGHMTNVSNTLKNLQNIVDGPIEVVSITENIACICNEEGKLRGLPKNFILGQVMKDVIVGDVIIVGVDGEDFCDLDLQFGTWKILLDSWGN